jgi:hypothetical protein
MNLWTSVSETEITMNRDLNRGINEFKRGYQPRSNLVKDENGDVLANCLNRWKNYFSQSLNVLRVNDVRQKYIHLRR